MEDATPEAASSDTGSTSADTGSADTSTPVTDAGPIMISAPDDTWTWVNIPGAVCGNGSATGIGVNPHAGATHLLIYLQGGGACTTGDECWGASPVASNMTGYGATDFATDATKELSIFQRTSSLGNPWDDADLVFVPYCTGDLHIGTAMTSLTPTGGKPTPTYFYGGHNVDLDLASLALTYKGLTHVWLSGISAGGFGSYLNQDFAARAFPGIPLDIVDDSGPAVPIMVGGITVTVAEIPWGVQLPAGCPTCMSLVDVFNYDRKTYPMSKYAFLTYQTDAVLPSFFYPGVALSTSEPEFAMELQTFIMSFASDPNAHAFVAESTGHGVLIGEDTTADPYILPWLTEMATDSSMWANEMH
jgi:hypothetical protein